MSRDSNLQTAARQIPPQPLPRSHSNTQRNAHPRYWHRTTPGQVMRRRGVGGAWLYVQARLGTRAGVRGSRGKQRRHVAHDATHFTRADTAESAAYTGSLSRTGRQQAHSGMAVKGRLARRCTSDVGGRRGSRQSCGHASGVAGYARGLQYTQPTARHCSARLKRPACQRRSPPTPAHSSQGA